MINLQTVAQMLSEQNNILILTHRSPDGDTLGSAYALRSALQKLGKTAYVLNDAHVSRKLAFMMEDHPTMPEGFVASYVVTVDTAEVSLLGDRRAEFESCVDLCIDHHISNSMYAKHTYLDAKAASVGEIIFDLIAQFGVALDMQMARDLYVSIVSDTGCFKFSNTTPKTLQIASELIKFDFGFTQLLRNLFDMKTKEQLAIERLVLDTLELHEDGKIAMITVTTKMMEDTKTTSDDLEGFAQMPRYIEGVIVGITMKQRAPQTWRVSLRSSGVFNAAEVCAVFGGGGHLRAAGCEILGTQSEAKEKLLTTVRSFMGIDA